MFISSIIHISPQKETVQMSINWWTGKQKLVYHTTEYSWSMKRNGVVMHSTAWVTFKTIMLSGRSQTQEITYCRISLKEKSRKCKFIVTDSRLISWGVGVWVRGACKQHEVSFWGDSVSNLDCGDGYTTLYIY